MFDLSVPQNSAKGGKRIKKLISSMSCFRFEADAKVLCLVGINFKNPSKILVVPSCISLTNSLTKFLQSYKLTITLINNGQLSRKEKVFVLTTGAILEPYFFRNFIIMDL